MAFWARAASRHWLFPKIQPVFLHSLGHLPLFARARASNDGNAGGTIVFGVIQSIAQRSPKSTCIPLVDSTAACQLYDQRGGRATFTSRVRLLTSFAWGACSTARECRCFRRLTSLLPGQQNKRSHATGFRIRCGGTIRTNPRYLLTARIHSGGTMNGLSFKLPRTLLELTSKGSWRGTMLRQRRMPRSA
jgi:hypothetical protein